MSFGILHKQHASTVLTSLQQDDAQPCTTAQAFLQSTGSTGIFPNEWLTSDIAANPHHGLGASKIPSQIINKGTTPQVSFHVLFEIAPHKRDYFFLVSSCSAASLARLSRVPARRLLARAIRMDEKTQVLRSSSVMVRALIDGKAWEMGRTGPVSWVANFLSASCTYKQKSE